MTPLAGMQRLIDHTMPEAGSFLEMLRPYRGLQIDILDDVMSSLAAAGPLLRSPCPPRELISAVWSLSSLGRSWGTEPGGMLQRNALITPHDTEVLRAFLDRFDFEVLQLLEVAPQPPQAGGMNVEVSLWMASRTRWAHLVKTIGMPVVPRVGEWLKFRNAEQGDSTPWRVTQVTYRENSTIEVWTELLDDIDGRGFSFATEEEFDEYFSSYLAEGWRCEGGVGPNRRLLGRSS